GGWSGLCAPIRLVCPVCWSRRNTLSPVVVEPAIRFVADEAKTMRWPSVVIEAPTELPSPWVPSSATLIRSTPPSSVIPMDSADAVPCGTAVPAHTATAAVRATRTRLVVLPFVLPRIFPPTYDTASPPVPHWRLTRMQP